jgi:competence protein ComEA
VRKILDNIECYVAKEGKYMKVKILGVDVYVRKEVLAAVVIVIATLLGITGYMIIKHDRKIIIEAKEDDTSAQEVVSSGRQDETKPAQVEEEKKEVEKIKVYIVGCVNKPGIVTLQKGQLVADAIEAAGGYTPEADINNINLVYQLKENVMLHIKSKDETLEESSAGQAGKGITIINDDTGVIVGGTSQSKNPGKININTASVGELDTLPGIGEATAQDIIDYREKNGPFKDIKDIMNVPRIKDSRFNSIKDFITVD